MTNKIANIAAILLFSTMFVFMITSSVGDSAIFDEVAHIGAGYTYLKYQDSRLNPEHPPLIKDLAALPLLFLHLNFDTNRNFWTAPNVNDRQWMAGSALLYEFGNNADQILFWSRLPIMLLSIIFGWLIFSWVKKRYGNKAALLTTIFYSLSPTFIAHSRFVTTDLAASLGFFLGIIFFLDFLEKRTAKSLILTGIIFGIVQLFKFSLVLLVPIYLILGILWVLAMRAKAASNEISGLVAEYNSGLCRDENEEISGIAALTRLIGQIILIGLIGLGVIYGVYAFHVWNYPQTQQLADAKYVLAGYKAPLVADIDFKLITDKFTRPIGQYLLGFLMVARRTAGGNSAYFEGEISSKGWPSYFPTLMLVKEQLGFYIFALIAAIFGILKIRKGRKSKQAFSEWISNNFSVAASIVFIVFYLAWSIWSPLNIGVRHALPIFPFLYFLVALAVVKWEAGAIGGQTGNIPGYLISSLLIFWMLAEIVFAFPFYLSYYNILGGGIKNGYLIATDSNYDWGQDLKRLSAWIESPVTGPGVDKIYLDYFGGGSPRYYLGNIYEPWLASNGAPPAGSYFAVSINSLTGNNAYGWLDGKAPIGRAGSSILIYKF